MGLKSRFGPFWNELRRRKVVRAGGFYAVSAFVALQLGEIVLPAFNTPDWALQSLVVAAALGLPVVLAVAWAYELTSEGLRRTQDSPAGTSGQGAVRSLAPRLALLAVTTVSVGFAAVWFSRSFMSASDGNDSGWRSSFWAARQARLGAGPGPSDAGGPRGVPLFANFDPEAPVAAIAVLPLANFAEGEGDLFARQLHDEIINQLTGMTSLRVVSRTSVARYADTTMQLPRIAQELRVQAVVTGSVAMTAENDSVRISIQLLHAPSDTHLMTRTYQREMKDILRLQTEIALEIAQAVQAEVEGGPAAPSVEHVAAVDPEAHQAYLQGWEELDHELGLDVHELGLAAADMGVGAGVDAGDLGAEAGDLGTDAGRARAEALDRARAEALDRAAAQAMQHFSEAVGIDSTFGLAWLGRAEAGLVLLAKSGAVVLPGEVPDAALGEPAEVVAGELAIRVGVEPGAAGVDAGHEVVDGTAGRRERGGAGGVVGGPLVAGAPHEVVARIQESLDRAEALGAPKRELDVFRIALLNVAKEVDEGLAADVETALTAAGVATDSLVRAYVRSSTEIGRRAERFVADRGSRPAPMAGEGRALARRRRAAQRFLDSGQYDRAAASYWELTTADPTDEVNWLVLEDLHLLRGDYAGAVKVREQHILATQDDTPERAERIDELWETFDEDDRGSYWRLRLREAQARQARGEHVPHTVQAFTAVGLGDVDQAFEHLEEAVNRREPFLGMSLASPIWDPIRGDARFGRVAERVWRPGG